MTYNQPHHNYDETRIDNYDGQQYYQQQYQQPQQQNYAQPQYQPEKLLAGRFDSKKVAVNLSVFAVLAMAVTFAIVYLVQVLVGLIPNYVTGDASRALVTGIMAGVIGVIAGLLYIPVVGTSNEKLFRYAILALTTVAIVMWVVLGGLLQGDWYTLVTLAGILCTSGIAYATPSRIDAADVYNR